MNYYRLRRMNSYWAALKLKKAIPELKNVDTELIDSYIRSSNFNIFEEKKKPVNSWVRVTLPLALVVILCLIALSPIKFMITGSWGYGNLKLLNWFRKLGF